MEIVRAIEAQIAKTEHDQPSWPLRLVMLAIATIAIGGTLALIPFINPETRPTALTILRRPAAVLRPNSVVVAPFRNETGDPLLDPLGSYAAGDVTEGLLRLNLFDVVDSRSAVIADSIVGRIPWLLRFAGRERALAREAGARVVISGRYYRDDQALRFQGQISDVTTGKLLHALPEVSGPAADTRVVVSKLRNQVMAGMWQGSGTTLQMSLGQVTDPPSLEAYEEMERGLVAFLRFDTTFAVHLRRAEALDSTYATPVVLQAMGVYRDRYEEAANAIARADRLRDRMMPAERALMENARAQLQADPEAALRWAEEAMTLLPASREAPLLVAGTALQLRRPRVALAALDRTDADRGSNLISAYYWRHRAVAHHQLGAHERALMAVRDGRARFPRDDELARLEVGELADLGRIAEIGATIEHAQSTLAQLRIATDAVGALAALDHLSEARSLAGEWLDRSAVDGDGDARLRLELRIQLHAARDEWERIGTLVAPLARADTGRRSLWDQMVLGVVAAHRGDRHAAAAVDDALRKSSGRWDFGETDWWRARIAAHEGDEARAIQLLSSAIESGVCLHGTIDPFERDVWLAPLAGSRAFLALRGTTR
jgi:TolB-like protein/tetratricopeptide (TPR) repeat protein